ncbi:Casein kinase I isoform alpha [Actinomortierella ambigua]|nr:Casein kinase I isoform alpha [Actinomortierella ambigua]
MGSSTVIIGGQYRVLGKIGEGSFGEVYRATHIDTGVDYAIKREPINVPHPQLIHEAKMYEKLKGEEGVARMHWFGREGAYHALVLDLLGPNLKQVRREVETFPLSFVIELGVQIIDIIEGIHRKGIVYRDIKPENFLLENDIQLPLPSTLQRAAAVASSSFSDHPIYFFNDTRQRQQSIDTALSVSPGSPLVLNYGRPRVSIVDFGLATYYRDASGKHLPNRGSTRHKIGTARYASINIHNCREHSRRDDIESIGYMLLEMLLGKLPWAGISAKNSHQGWAKMRDLKEEIEMDELCDGLPRGFMSFVGYARSLKFDEQPNYDHLRHLLRACAGRGPESQTVRCYREVPGGAHHSHSASYGRSLESAFRELDLHANDHFGRGTKGVVSGRMEKENSRVHEHEQRDWRFRPDQDNQGPGRRHQGRYNPGSVWTTTPPDDKKTGSILMSQSQQDLFGKDKTEGSSTQDWSLQDQEDPTMQHADHLYDGPPTPAFSKGRSRGRKNSWGEDEPSARWGEDEDRPPPPSPDRDNTGAIPAHDAIHANPHHHHQHHRSDGAAGLGVWQPDSPPKDTKDKNGRREPASQQQHAAKNSNSWNRSHMFARVGRAPQDARLYSTEPPYDLLPQSPLQDVFVTKMGNVHPLCTTAGGPSASDSSQPPTPTQPIPIGNPFPSVLPSSGEPGHPTPQGRGSISGHGQGGQGRWRGGRKASLVSDSNPFFPHGLPNSTANSNINNSNHHQHPRPICNHGPMARSGLDNTSTVANGKGGVQTNGHGGANGHCYTVGFSQGRQYSSRHNNNNGNNHNGANNNNANTYHHHPHHYHHHQGHHGDRNDGPTAHNNNADSHGRRMRTRKRSTASLSSLHDHGSARNFFGSGYHTVHSGGEWSKPK